MHHLNDRLVYLTCRIALQLFAQGLFQAGYRDRAATIWSSLLLEDADRGQQAELLRRCLRWGMGHGKSCGSASVPAYALLGQRSRCFPPGHARRSCWTEEPSGVGRGGDDNYIFQKLVLLFEGRSLNWDQLVELAEQAQLGDQFVLRWAVCGAATGS